MVVCLQKFRVFYLVMASTQEQQSRLTCAYLQRWRLKMLDRKVLCCLHWAFSNSSGHAEYMNNPTWWLGHAGRFWQFSVTVLNSALPCSDPCTELEQFQSQIFLSSEFCWRLAQHPWRHWEQRSFFSLITSSVFLNSYRIAATSNINLPLMPFTLAKLSRLIAECNGTFLHIGVPGRMQATLSSALE